MIRCLNCHGPVEPRSAGSWCPACNDYVFVIAADSSIAYRPEPDDVDGSYLITNIDAPEWSKP